MSLRYSVIVPYFRTPEIMRFCLHSIFRFARGEPEVIVIDNDPAHPGSKMLDEYPQLVRIDNPKAVLGSAGHFEALDLGLAKASHDRVCLVHSDTVFLRAGWDLEWFGRLDRENLAAIGTFEREANPFRTVRQRLRDQWRHWRHQPRPRGLHTKLMLFWLVTYKSVLQSLNYSFLRQSDSNLGCFEGQRNGLEALSRHQTSDFVWHTSDVTSILTGQLTDAASLKSYHEKRALLLGHPFIREHFADVLAKIDAGA